MLGAARELIEDLAPDTRTGGDPNPTDQERLERIDGRLPAGWVGVEGDPDWGDQTPGDDVGEVELPELPPELTPEPDSLPEVVAATHDGEDGGEGQEADAVSETEDIDQAVASVPPELWADPADFPHLQ